MYLEFPSLNNVFLSTDIDLCAMLPNNSLAYSWLIATHWLYVDLYGNVFILFWMFWLIVPMKTVRLLQFGKLYCRIRNWRLTTCVLILLQNEVIKIFHQQIYSKQSKLSFQLNILNLDARGRNLLLTDLEYITSESCILLSLQTKVLQKMFINIQLNQCICCWTS